MVTDQKFFEITDEVIQACDVCLKYIKPVPRPVFGFAWANDFNQTVGMDLKELGPNFWFLHIIDEFTRSSNAVIKKFLQCWISLFAASQKVISDNRREFDSNEFRDLCENFNIIVKTDTSIFSLG